MAKKQKKTKVKKTGKSFWSFLRRDKKASASKSATKNTRSLAGCLWAVVCIVMILSLAAMAWGFRWLEDYAWLNIMPKKSQSISLILVDKPEWVNLELQNRIFTLARSSTPIVIDEKIAGRIADNLNKMEWMSNVSVHTLQSSILINAEYRKPEAFISYKDQRYYVDNSLTVLSYVPMPELGILEIKGYHSKSKPVPGSVWRQDDIEAGIRLIKVLSAMDKARNLSKPLLSEIAYLDVSDYGTRNANKSQLSLVAHDGTKILWGAPPGKAKANLEADEAEKLKKLYGFYEQYGTIQGVVRYIDPRLPQESIPTPGF